MRIKDGIIYWYYSDAPPNIVKRQIQHINRNLLGLAKPIMRNNLPLTNEKDDEKY